MTKRGPREPAPLALILPLLVLTVLLGWAAGPASGLPQSALPSLRQRREAAARAERGRVWTAEEYRLEPEVAAAGLAAARALVEHGRSGGPSAAATREEELEPHTAAAAKYAAGLIHEWLGRDRPAGLLPGMDKERMLLLDNVLAAVLRNVYKHHRQLRRQRDRLQIGNELPDSHHHQRHEQEEEEEEDGASSSEMEHLLSLATQRPRLCTTPELCRRVIGQSVEHQRPALNYAYQQYRPRQQLELEEQQPRIVHALGPSKRNRPVPKPQRLQKSVAVRQPSALSTQVQQQKSPAQAVSAVSSGIASQFLMRNVRGNRQYDVPQIECPTSDQGMERFACPSPDFIGRYRCIDDNMLCDGFRDCPQGEDEDRQGCLFYKTTKAHLDVLADALLRWVRGRRRR